MKGHTLSWHDTRTASSCTLRIRQDLPVDVRAKQRAASRIWEDTLALFKKYKCQISDYRLG
eukprot:9328436-Pyramimonas_sp.AAC.1